MITAQIQGSTTRRRTWRAAAAALAVSALALAGCSGGGDAGTGDEGGDAAPSQMTVVTFLPLESFSFTPEMFAAAGGYFEDHGLDVELQPVQGSSAAIQSVIGGAAELTRVSTVDVFPGMEQGQPVKAVATMAYASNLRVVSFEDNPIEDAADMEGATIGMGSVGGTSEKMLNFALDAADVPRDSVTRQAVPVTGATYELVKQGQLDGYIVSLDTSIAIAQQNPDAVISPAGLTDSPERHVWVATDTTLADDAAVDRVERFLAAIKEATQFVIDDQENDFENVLQIMRDSGLYDFAALNDDAIAVEALNQYVTKTWVDETGAVTGLLENDEAAWETTYEVYVDGGLLEGGGDPAEWITSDLVPTD